MEIKGKPIKTGGLMFSEVGWRTGFSGFENTLFAEESGAGKV
jgi:hypothetical protein